MNKPPPRTAPPGWLQKFGSALMSIAFIAFVCWIVNGAAGGGRFLWIVGGLFLAPIVLYLLFLAAIGFSFVREGKRNMRAAQQRERERDERGR